MTMPWTELIGWFLAAATCVAAFNIFFENE